MATRLKAHLRGQVSGDRFGVNRTVTKIPAALTMTKAWLTLKTNATDLDAAAVLQKTITSSFVAGSGQITDTGHDVVGPPADRVGTLAFIVTEAESLQLGSARIYLHDIQIKFSDNSIGTLEIGDLLLDRGVTDAVS